MSGKKQNPNISRSPSSPSGLEDDPPWEREPLEDEEITNTTTGTLSSEDSQSKLSGFDDTVITKPPDRVHADLFGGGESLFGETSRLEIFKAEARGLSKKIRNWHDEHPVRTWKILGALAAILVILGIIMLFPKRSTKPSLPLKNIAETTNQQAVAPPVVLGEDRAPSTDKAIPGEILIVTNPAGATIFVDGQAQAGTTPLRISGVSSGIEHQIDINLSGYEPYQSRITLAAGEKKQLQLNLVLQRNSLNIRSEPTGAEVLVDGESVGRTPVGGSFTMVLDPQKSQIRVELKYDGYETFAAVYPVMNKDIELYAKLRPQKNPPNEPPSVTAKPTTTTKPPPQVSAGTGNGFLTLSANPWAIVYINDRRLGRRTPIHKMKWPVGRHKIHFVNPQNGKERTVYVTLTEGKERSLGVDLK